MAVSRPAIALWSVFGLIAAVACLWPLPGGMVVMNDDIKFVRSPACELPLMEELRLAWSSSPSFRPLEILMGRLCDPVSLVCPWVPPVQMAGFATLVWAVIRLAGQVMPGEPRLAPLTLLFVAVSPATTCSLWQMDTCSQTWSAAAGLWACVHAWRGAEQAARGLWPWPTVAWLTTLFAFLLAIKETSLGWSLGVGGSVLACAAWRTRGDRGSSTRTLTLAVPAVALPVAFLAVRMATGAIGRSLEGDDGSRYQVELGMGTVANLMLSLGAAGATGPYHLVGDSGASLALRALPAVAAVALALPVAACVEFLLLRGKPEEKSMIGRAATLVLATSGSLAVTCVVQSVSELYGFGFNAALSLTLAAVVLGILRQRPSRAVAGTLVCCVAVALAIGAFGLVGRAHHMAITWRLSARGNAALLDAMDRTPPASVTLCFDASCRPTFSYGQYVIPLQQSMDILRTMEWAARRRPGLEFLLVMDRACSQDRGTVTMPCEGVRDHGRW